MTAQRKQAIRHRFTVGASMSNGSIAKNVIMTIKDIQRGTAVPFHTPTGAWLIIY